MSINRKNRPFIRKMMDKNSTLKYVFETSSMYNIAPIFEMYRTFTNQIRFLKTSIIA